TGGRMRSLTNGRTLGRIRVRLEPRPRSTSRVAEGVSSVEVERLDHDLQGTERPTTVNRISVLDHGVPPRTGTRARMRGTAVDEAAGGAHGAHRIVVHRRRREPDRVRRVVAGGPHRRADPQPRAG